MAEPQEPLTADGYLDIFESVTDVEYHQPLLATPGAARIYQMQARTQAALARSIYVAAEGRFLRRHSASTAEPASGWRYARCEIDVERTRDLPDARYVDAGAMVLRGPAGREYHNEASAYWSPNDPQPRKTLVFRCTVPGFVGNLDFLADDNGLLTLEGIGDAPNTEPDLGILDHVLLSDGRSGATASILAPANYQSPSVIRDSGKGDMFSTTHRALYVRILDAANSENIGRVLRILEVRAPGIEYPAGSGLYPHEITVDDLPELVKLKAAKLDDGGVFTDFTAEADSNVSDDVELLPAVPAVGDAFYFGLDDPMLGVALAITTPSTSDLTLAWEYWDGVSWLPYPGIVDGSQAYQLAGEVRVEAPTLPIFWSQNTVDGIQAYWIRARVTAVVAPGDQPLAARIRGLKSVRLAPEIDSVIWAVEDWSDLGFALRRLQAPTGGRDADLDAIAWERGMTRASNESDESLRDRVSSLPDVVTPAAIRRTVNRALAPYNLRGEALDVANGLDGLFADLDFLDYYQAGDVFPLNPHKLLLTDPIAYGGFLVFVPRLGDGEFGVFCDDSPVFWLEPEQKFLAGATDMCFLDGFPVTAYAVYGAIWDQVNATKAFGVAFLILLDERLNVPAC